MARLLIALFALLAPLLLVQAENIQIDAKAPSQPLPHFWESTFGSGRAILTLRESYRDDLRAVHAITGFRYVRFHAIFHDEVGVYNEDEHGNPIYNFAYVDQIYDGLLKNGVRPLVEISFMPKKLAFNPDALHPFWYKQNVSPPKSMEKWDGLVTAFAHHLVERYGADEVAQWYFEVWNEPNIDFWEGVPRDRSYFELYDHTARALKQVNPRLRVGGPATAAADWVEKFLAHTAKASVPVDFVSSHGYADDTVENLFGTDENISVDHRVGRAVAKVRNQIRASATPNLPLLWTEWNVPGQNGLRDTAYVGPSLANTIRECVGLVDALSFWTFSDVFEEGGPIPQPFEGHFGLRAVGGINKPSFYDFALLHTLGNEILPNPDPNTIVTRRNDGTLVIALWNLTDADHPTGPARTFNLQLSGLPVGAKATWRRVDDGHSNTLAAYKAMGSPQSPTEQQIAEINRRTQLSPAESITLSNGTAQLILNANCLAVIEVQPKP